ncbi:MAG: DUF3857 and transglutaminase domain-containing protein [Deltaproteobacteria bacterium]|nr:DUF3857 and transglutaminase domain-containing protein [Deltaproteobacteria bacterium]
MKISKILLVLAAAGLAAGCAASGKAIIDQYQNVTPNRFEGAVAVVLEEKQTETVSESGRELVTEFFTRIKIMNRKALDCGEDAPNCRLKRMLGYEPDFDEVELVEARTITPDGTIIEIDRDDDMSDGTSTSWVYPEEYGRGLVWTAKGVVPGAIIEEHWRIRSKKIHGVGGTYFQDQDPVLEATYTIDAPADYGYTWKTYNIDIKPTEKKVGNRIIRTWTAKDVAPIVIEEGMVAVDDVIAKLMVGTSHIYSYEDVSPNTKSGTWEERGQFQADLNKTRQEVTKEVQAVIDQIAASAKTETGKVKAIWEWMNKNIRYVQRKSSAKDRGILPLSVHTVCTSKYGDCKAMGGIISVMARGVGLVADPVSIGTRDQRGAVELEVPCHQSNHVIGRVEADKQVYYLDATTRSFDYKTNPDRNQGVHVTVARDGAPFVDLVPIQPPEASVSTLTTVFKPGKDGTMEFETKRSTTGNLAGNLRSRAYSYTPEKWNKWIESILALSYPQISISEQSIAGKEDNNKNFDIMVKAKIPRALQPAGKGISFEVKEPFLSGVFQYFELPKRRYGLDMGFLWVRNNRYEVLIPAGMKPTGLPKNVMFEDDFVKTERLIQIENDKIVSQYTMVVKKLIIPADRYLEARKSYQKALDASSFVIIFEPENGKKIAKEG